MMLTTTEARAHLTIVDTLDLVLKHNLHYKHALKVMWRPLEAFAPRCNCRLVLRFGPWMGGSRMVMCRCGVSYWESKL